MIKRSTASHGRAVDPTPNDCKAREVIHSGMAGIVNDCDRVNSRLWGILRDLTDGLAQQMFFWGCDVTHPGGNGLKRAGLERIARPDSGGEGTSRYHLERIGGRIELHGFCAGWRPADPEAEGSLYIRREHRIFMTSGEVNPGRYDMRRLRSGTAGEILSTMGPFLRWWADYEEWAAETFGHDWRQSCWRGYLKLRPHRPWFPPGEGLRWLRGFINAPCNAERPRNILRSRKTAGLAFHSRRNRPFA